MDPNSCLEKLVRKHHYSLRNSPEERSSQGPLFLIEIIFLPNFTLHTHSLHSSHPFSFVSFSIRIFPLFVLCPFCTFTLDLGLFFLQMDTFRIESRHFTVKYCNMILTCYASRIVTSALLVYEDEVISNVTPGNKCHNNIDSIRKYYEFSLPGCNNNNNNNNNNNINKNKEG
jgi:hypothetical protein